MGNFRLLSKREVDLAKGKDRQREIDEGMKLAKRVDTLRETASEEEKGLETFRINALTQIQKETEPKLKELHELDTKIRSRTTELEILMKPLDEKWVHVHQKEADLLFREEEVAQEESKLRLSVAANIERERLNEIERERIADERSRSSEILVRNEELHANAQRILRDTAEKDAIMNAALALREKQVAKREHVVLEQKNRVDEHERRLIKYENTLFVREQNLKDNEKLLLISQ